MTPHKVVKARGHDHCSVCLRAIKRVGTRWAHYRLLRWDPTAKEYVVGLSR